MHLRRVAAAAAAFSLALVGCGPRVPRFHGLADAPRRLSDFDLFAGDPVAQAPADGVLPYDLTTPLFSDYASKHRFVVLPPGEAASYEEAASFEFPVGTIIAKTFAYPLDEADPERGERLIETRILAHLEDGWIGLPYVWNDEQTEATLRIAGARLEVEWVDATGEARSHGYLVPNANQCKGCHRSTDAGMGPLGPKARYLNRDYAYAEGSENQLAHWTRTGALTGAPEPSAAPRTPTWSDPASGSLDERARAYLEINCAHCHNPEGPARTTGLDLSWSEHDPVALGVYKFPVAAGRGSGDRLFGIVPGHPEKSILMYRMESLDPGVMMPELGRRLVHQEGIDLVRQWIAAMPEPEGRTAPTAPAR